MKELTQQECAGVQGGTGGAETVLSYSFVGGAIGSVSGAILLAGNAVGDYAFIGNTLGAALGWVYGGIIGVAVGALVGIATISSANPRYY
ncbi:MAG: hypothetical protein AB7I18_03840 [Candidatus Berkiella sp.]